MPLPILRLHTPRGEGMGRVPQLRHARPLRRRLPALPPNAVPAIDMFHIVKLVVSAMDSARYRAFKEDRGDPINGYAKKHRRDFLCRQGGPAMGRRDMLARALMASGGLLDVYEAEQAMLGMVDGLAKRPPKEELEWIAPRLEKSGIADAHKAAESIRKWMMPQISKTFELRVAGEMHSSSISEPRNAQIKELISASNGLVDFKRMRKRVLFMYSDGTERESPKADEGGDPGAKDGEEAPRIPVNGRRAETTRNLRSPSTPTTQNHAGFKRAQKSPG